MQISLSRIFKLISILKIIYSRLHYLTVDFFLVWKMFLNTSISWTVGIYLKTYYDDEAAIYRSGGRSALLKTFPYKNIHWAAFFFSSYICANKE